VNEEIMVATVVESEQLTGQSIQGVRRALDVLSLFGSTDAPTLGVTEVAVELGLSKAVVHRILTALRVTGFVELDEATHRYKLGPQIVALGLRYLDRLDARGVVHEAIVRLSAETNETVTFSVRAGFERVYIDQVTPDRDVKMVVQLGKSFPLHTGGSSKALLAFMDEADQQQYLESHQLVALTSRSITDPAQLRREIATIKKRGYASSLGERDESAGSVAAPIFGYTGSLVGVISVSGPIERFRSEIEEAAEALLRTVADVSRRLGYHQPA
jgi:DNA-binding IclR family transcriptional regulator